MKPNFSIVLIAKQEEKTLPRLLKSLEEFKARGGQTILVDTGSTDQTVKVAKDWGCEVTGVGERFITTIDADLANKINQRFVVDGEEPIVKEGDRTFHFARARNYAASLASNDFIWMPDCDEEFTKLDLDTIEQTIKSADRLEYEFCFSHQADGSPALRFKHSKAYNRQKFSWRGRVHEVLAGSGNTVYLPESQVFLEHWQQPAEHRSNYLIGLAVACYQGEGAAESPDRASHYLAREMLYRGRYKSAIKEFERHIAMKAWPVEAAQSQSFIGDCYKALGQTDKAVEAYQKSFNMESGRREPLIRLAELYREKDDFQRVACYCYAALQIPLNSYYANDAAHYAQKPHELLYWALWYLGNKAAAKVHFDVAMHYQPDMFLKDAQFFYELPTVSFIVPHLALGNPTREEGLQKCIESIRQLNYPADKIDYVVLDSGLTVPEKVKEGLAKTKGEYICYAANDMTFDPNSLLHAVIASQRENKALVSFNEGTLLEDLGNICTHFILKRSFIPQLERGEVFSLDLHHVGVDNFLWSQADTVGEAFYCQSAKITHSHFAKGADYDDVYKRGWETAEKDRAILKKKLATLYGDRGE